MPGAKSMDAHFSWHCGLNLDRYAQITGMIEAIDLLLSVAASRKA
jgi:hypothetical protein